MVTRRTFLVTGLAGSATLAVALWATRTQREEPLEAPIQELPRFVPGTPVHAMMAAVASALLAGALPQDAAAREAALADTLAILDKAIAGLPPASRHELDQLFALLTFAPTRIVLARIGRPWQHAQLADVDAFLYRLRESSLTLLRSAYDALHQLVFAAWYGQTRTWADIGYPGPPAVGREG